MCRLIVVGMLVPAALLACSAVTVAMDGKIFLGHNNDYRFSADLKLRVVPAHDGLFGRICISMETVPGWTPVGMKCMNDQGLAITHAVVPKGQAPYNPDKPQFRHNFLEKIVAESATVKQAVAMVQAYTFPPEHNANIHIMLADASGDSAVIEWIEGQVKVIRRTGNFQIMTNSLVGAALVTDGPNSRYARGTRVLTGVREASPAAVVAALKEVSIHGRHQGVEVGSVESAVFDLTGRKVHLYYKRDFDHPLTLSLDEELGKGARMVAMKELFPNPVPFEPGDRYENGPVVAKR